MKVNYVQKFYCHSCNKETLGVIFAFKTSHGTNQCIVCSNYFNIFSMQYLYMINNKNDELMNGAIKIDPITKFVVGSEGYNAYYHPTIEENPIGRPITQFAKESEDDSAYYQINKKRYR